SGSSMPLTSRSWRPLAACTLGPAQVQSQCARAWAPCAAFQAALKCRLHRGRKMIRRLGLGIFGIALSVGIHGAVAAAPACPGNPDALGTERVLPVSAATTPRVGRKHFPDTLPLAPKEVVLTFDDGPWPSTTARVLDALKHECVKASFFLLGRN